MTEHIAHDSPEYWQAVQLRREVLRLPLGMDFSAEELKAEHSQWHVVARQEGAIIATLSAIGVDEQTIKFRQMAVHPEAQGHGIGTRLMQQAHILAQKAGYRHAMLHARQTAQRFYEQLGYEAYGKPFTEVGLPHIAMRCGLVP